MKKLIFVKDEDGLYDKDPKKHADAKLIKRTTLGELYRATCPTSCHRSPAPRRVAHARGTSSACRSSTA